MVIYSESNYIDDTDECVSKQNTHEREILSNYNRLQTKGRALSVADPSLGSNPG
jgi:hypothetical protein